jgi:hypothetical protein
MRPNTSGDRVAIPAGLMIRAGVLWESSWHDKSPTQREGIAKHGQRFVEPAPCSLGQQTSDSNRPVSQGMMVFYGPCSKASRPMGRCLEIPLHAALRRVEALAREQLMRTTNRRWRPRSAVRRLHASCHADTRLSLRGLQRPTPAPKAAGDVPSLRAATVSPVDMIWVGSSLPPEWGGVRLGPNVQSVYD